MKVLHLVSSPTLTGPADPALGLAKAQRACLGIEADLACDRVREGNLIEKAREANVPVIDGLRLCTKSGPFTALADRHALRAISRRYDLLHVHTSHDHALAVSIRTPARIVRTIDHPRSTARRGLQGYAYARTDGLILIAEPHRDRLAASYPRLDTERMSVVRGAVDADRFHPGVDGRPLREAHGIPPGAFVFGMISRIKPGRRHDLLVGAFVRLLERHPGRDVRIVFIGKGEGEPALRSAIAEHGLDRAASLFGFRDADLPEAFRSCDATVLLAEGNDAGCRAVLESLAVGVPVIGARHPAIAEALEGAGCGLLVEPDDPADLLRALEAVLSLDGATRAAWADNARARVVARYSERSRAEAVAGFYRRVLAMEPVR